MSGFGRARNFGEASVQYSYFYDSKPNPDHGKAVSGGFLTVNGVSEGSSGFRWLKQVQEVQ